MLKKTDCKLNDTTYTKYVTVYRDDSVPVKARILYFHGGGLIFGSRLDLTEGHLKALTAAGYEIDACDYPLAPAAGLEEILDDVCASINCLSTGNHVGAVSSADERSASETVSNATAGSVDCKADERSAAAASDAAAGSADCMADEHSASEAASLAAAEDGALPYYLWGRSAGAYLCLIAAASGRLVQPPKGILSYYGYGFLCDNWFMTPAPWYCKLPPVDESCLAHASAVPDADGSLDEHYSIYVYARQTGKWKDIIYRGREKFFYLNYSLRTCDALPCPLFCAHSTGDPDVPYSEFLELCAKYPAERFIAPVNEHDFDRDAQSPFTEQLLEATLKFLAEH